uniref:Uncharacterized protein n=1 Tax=Anopheles atroparvus TaxID=41427 RepID=A0A182JFL4_ANOAO
MLRRDFGSPTEDPSVPARFDRYCVLRPSSTLSRSTRSSSMSSMSNIGTCPPSSAGWWRKVPETEGFARTRFKPAGGHDADDSLELACHNSADHDQPAQGRRAGRPFNLVPLAVKALQSFSGPEKLAGDGEQAQLCPEGLLTVFKGFHGKLYYDYSSCCITNRSTALDQNGHDLPSRPQHMKFQQQQLNL